MWWESMDVFSIFILTLTKWYTVLTFLQSFTFLALKLNLVATHLYCLNFGALIESNVKNSGPATHFWVATHHLRTPDIFHLIGSLHGHILYNNLVTKLFSLSTYCLYNLSRLQSLRKTYSQTRKWMFSKKTCFYN